MLGDTARTTLSECCRQSQLLGIEQSFVAKADNQVNHQGGQTLHMQCRSAIMSSMQLYGYQQHSTAQHSTVQHSTAQHSTAQHSTAQHSTYGPCRFEHPACMQLCRHIHDRLVQTWQSAPSRKADLDVDDMTQIAKKSKTNAAHQTGSESVRQC